MYAGLPLNMVLMWQTFFGIYNSDLDTKTLSISTTPRDFFFYSRVYTIIIR